MIIKNYVKIIISIVLVTILAITVYLISDHSSDHIPTEVAKGEIIFSLYDGNDELIINDTLVFYEEDNLFTLLNRHYDLVCADSRYEPDETCSYKFLYGRIILEIETVDSDWYSTVLSVYVNGTLSNKGVSLINLNDQDHITIRKTIINE
ncbi:hypothetical protein KHQ88_03630 [Mycoplasmatota bacterium]|nr:hypothetical protein KHQ88_03630 [Mycoplasmatota bacterium]